MHTETDSTACRTGPSNIRNVKAKTHHDSNHYWTQAEEENWGSVQTYVTIGVAGVSEVIRGTWSSGFEVNPISWGYGEYGIEVPDLGKEQYWPLVGLTGQDNQEGYKVQVWGWFYS